MTRPARTLAVLMVISVGLLAAPGAVRADDGEPMPRPPTVWAVGDSITAGVGTARPQVYSYPAQLRELGQVVEVVGTPGQCLVVVGCRNTPTMLETVESVLSIARPGDVLLLEAGANDLGRATDPQLKRGYRAVVRAGEARGVTVVVATIPPRGAQLAWLLALTERQRVGMNSWLRSRGWVLADFDVRLEVHTTGVLAPRFDSGDGLHPNARGARVMARVAARAIGGPGAS
jgi:lysophospholipase L1-like esterase